MSLSVAILPDRPTASCNSSSNWSLTESSSLAIARTPSYPRPRPGPPPRRLFAAHPTRAAVRARTPPRYARPTNSTRLTEARRQALRYAVADRRDYFGRLRDRMKATGFPADDPLYVAVCAAWEATHAVVRVVYVREGERKPQPPQPPPEAMRHVGPPGA